MLLTYHQFVYYKIVNIIANCRANCLTRGQILRFAESLPGSWLERDTLWSSCRINTSLSPQPRISSIYSSAGKVPVITEMAATAPTTIYNDMEKRAVALGKSLLMDHFHENWMKVCRVKMHFVQNSHIFAHISGERHAGFRQPRESSQLLVYIKHSRTPRSSRLVRSISMIAEVNVAENRQPTECLVIRVYLKV